MTSSRYRGGAALVTGASSGIGEAFASALAAAGADVLLTALPDERDRLERLAAELAARHEVRTEIAPADLSQAAGPGSLVEAADRLRFEPGVLINSAGFGVGGAFVDEPLEKQLAMIQVNVLALVALTGAFLPRMVARGDGVIVNVGSTAAFQPLPYMAVYAASKAFVLAFGEALWAEARPAGVRTVTLCSGPVATDFHARAGDNGAPRGIKRHIRRRYLTAEDVVAAALTAVEQDRPRAVLRLAGGRVLFGAASTVASVVPRRLEVLALERVSRWILLGR